MKNTKLHIVSLFTLSLLAGVVLISAVGVFYQAREVKTLSVGKKNSEEDKKQEKKISAAHGLEAVVVSVLDLDFGKEAVLTRPEILFLFRKAILVPKRFLISEKYFDTLFTHIISPNAP